MGFRLSKVQSWPRGMKAFSLTKIPESLTIDSTSKFRMWDCCYHVGILTRALLAEVLLFAFMALACPLSQAGDCAALISATIPDATVMKPGQIFTDGWT